MTPERTANLVVIGFWAVAFTLLGLALYHAGAAYLAIGGVLVLVVVIVGIPLYTKGKVELAILGFWALVFTLIGIAVYGHWGSAV